MGTNLIKIAWLPLEYAPLARDRILEVERSRGRGQGSALLPSQLSQGDSQEYITLTHKAQYILYIERRMHWAMSLMSASHSSPTPAPIWSLRSQCECSEKLIKIDVGQQEPRL